MSSDKRRVKGWKLASRECVPCRGGSRRCAAMKSGVSGGTRRMEVINEHHRSDVLIQDFRAALAFVNLVASLQRSRAITLNLIRLGLRRD